MSVTAVPLQPLARSTVPKLWIGIALALLVGAGLAWFGTSRLQYVTTAEGIRYRVLNAGTGPAMTKEDLGQMEIELRGPRGQILEATGKRVDPQTGQVGAPLPVTLDGFPPSITELKDQMRDGGVYQVIAPASKLLNAQQLPPTITATDLVELRLRMSIERGGLASARERMTEERTRQQQQIEQQMRQEMERGAVPGGPPAGPAGAPPPMPTPPPAPRGGR